jgi:hypothetical protein
MNYNRHQRERERIEFAGTACRWFSSMETYIDQGTLSNDGCESAVAARDFRFKILKGVRPILDVRRTGFHLGGLKDDSGKQR